MKYCPTCQRDYEDSQRFCPQDATPLADGAPAASGAGGAHNPGQQQRLPHGAPGETRKRKLWPFVVGGVAVLGLGFLLLLGLGAFFFTRSGRSDNANQIASANANTNPVGFPGYNDQPFDPNANAPAGGMNSTSARPPTPTPARRAWPGGREG